ncbi:MAG: hypothetical protein JXL84_15055 [Deltaproteobacteria bacterium]|nr:hypothetical protein [Deltaproteobacteria bacterium]
MKAISLWMPQAAWVCLKWKTIETRNHARFKALVGQRIAIHATQKIDEAAFFNERFLARLAAGDTGALGMQNMMMYAHMNRGKILCTAVVEKGLRCPNVDFVEREEWEKAAMCDIRDKYLLLLSDIKALSKPVPFSGRQFPFDVPDELLRQ